LSTFHDNEDVVKEIEKVKGKRENVGTAPQVFIFL